MSEVTSFIALGSNIDTDNSSRLDFLSSAIRQLAQNERIQVVGASHVYETLPVGYLDQNNFYNAVAKINTTMSASELLRFCLEVVERRAGRIRTTKDGPRTLDVDILLFGDEKIDEDGLQIPHPRMNERAFVIVPLNEIAPEVVGDITTYKFVDDMKGVKKLDNNFDSVIASYKAI